MAGKCSNMFLDVVRGRVGSVVGYTRGSSEDPQGVRPYVKPSNPKTMPQAVQRARFSGAVVMASLLSKISDHNVEGERVGLKNRSAFCKLLMALPHAVVGQDLFEAKLIAAKGSLRVSIAAADLDNPVSAFLSASMPLSKGSLGDCTPTFLVGEDNFVGTLTADKIKSLGLQVGDIITIVTFNKVKSADGTIYYEPSYKQYDVAVGTEIADIAFLNSAGSAAMTSFEGNWYVAVKGVSSVTSAAGVGVIIERNTDGKHLLSSSVVILEGLSVAATQAVYDSFRKKAVDYRSQFLYGAGL